MTKYFVWVSSTLGPVAQIWHDVQTDGSGKAKATLTPAKALADEDARSLEELKRAYPYEEK